MHRGNHDKNAIIKLKDERNQAKCLDFSYLKQKTNRKCWRHLFDFNAQIQEKQTTVLLSKGDERPSSEKQMALSKTLFECLWGLARWWFRPQIFSLLTSSAASCRNNRTFLWLFDQMTSDYPHQVSTSKQATQVFRRSIVQTLLTRSNHRACFYLVQTILESWAFKIVGFWAVWSEKATF